MEYGIIKDTTIQGIADSLRAKGFIASTRTEDVYKESMHFQTSNVTSDTDPTPTVAATDEMKERCYVDIPEASSIELVINLGMSYPEGQSTNYYRFYVWDADGNVAVKEPISKDYVGVHTYTIQGSSLSFGLNTSYVAMKDCYAGWIIDTYPLDAEGNRISYLTQEQVLNTIAPSAMAEAIYNSPAFPPKDAFKITGDCGNKFAYNGWNWFLELYADDLTSENITNASNMFQNNTIDRIPMTLNLSTSCSNTDNIFYGCTGITELPVINNFRAGSDLFYGCTNLTSLNNNQLANVPTGLPLDDTFYSCYCLRSIGNFLDNIPDVQKGNSIFGMHNTFNNCYSMDELVNLPYVYSTYGDSYFFGSCFNYCTRLKRVTFRNQTVNETTKSATMDLSTNVGWGGLNNFIYYGFDYDTQVKDDESYQLLKDNPDYWTTDMAYSRYNHDSAVETINSLPDVSINSTNSTIKFRGAAGSKTDGGAINTLTAEEIAVAAAKGWTVTLV